MRLAREGFKITERRRAGSRAGPMHEVPKAEHDTAIYQAASILDRIWHSSFRGTRANRSFRVAGCWLTTSRWVLRLVAEETDGRHAVSRDNADSRRRWSESEAMVHVASAQRHERSSGMRAAIKRTQLSRPRNLPQRLG